MTTFTVFQNLHSFKLFNFDQNILKSLKINGFYGPKFNISRFNVENVESFKHSAFSGESKFVFKK